MDTTGPLTPIKMARARLGQGHDEKEGCHIFLEASITAPSHSEPRRPPPPPSPAILYNFLDGEEPSSTESDRIPSSKMSFGGQTPTIIVLKEGPFYPTARPLQGHSPLEVEIQGRRTLERRCQTATRYTDSSLTMALCNRNRYLPGQGTDRLQH